MEIRIVEGQELAIQLIDDGTLDTVIRVNGEEYRFNPDGEASFDLDTDRIEWCIEEAIDTYLTDKGLK